MAESERPQGVEASDFTKQRNEAPCESAGTVAVNETPESSKAQSISDDNSSQMTRSEKSMVSFTAIIALATGAYAVIAFYQWGIMRDQLREIRDGSKDTKAIAEAAIKQADNTKTLAEAAKDQIKELQASVEEARRLAGAAHEANKIARENALAANRPWLGRSQGNIVDIEAGKVPKVNIGVKNHGSSPALEVESQAIFGLLETPTIPTAKIIEMVRKLPVKKVGTISPGQELALPFTMGGSLTARGIEQIAAGEIELHVFIILRYKDRLSINHHTYIYAPYDPKQKAVVYLRRPDMPNDD